MKRRKYAPRPAAVVPPTWSQVLTAMGTRGRLELCAGGHAYKVKGHSGACTFPASTVTDMLSDGILQPVPGAEWDLQRTPERCTT